MSTEELPPYWRVRVVGIDELEDTMNAWVCDGFSIDEYIDLGEQDMFGKHLFLVIAWNEAEYGVMAEDEGEGDPARLRERAE